MDSVRHLPCSLAARSDNCGAMRFEFEVLAAHSPASTALRDYIAAGYRRVYGAELEEFLPHLLAMSQAGHTAAALGLRTGNVRPFYLENYLDRPLEQALACAVGQPIDREAVVEIGNLFASEKGSSLALFIVMTAALAEAGLKWMTFTATPQVGKLIRRLNFAPLTLALADPARLGPKAAAWGSYYQSQPQVMAGNIQQALASGGRHPVVAAVLERYRPAVLQLAAALAAQGA